MFTVEKRVKTMCKHSSMKKMPEMTSLLMMFSSEKVITFFWLIRY